MAAQLVRGERLSLPEGKVSLQIGLPGLREDVTSVIVAELDTQGRGTGRIATNSSPSALGFVLESLGNLTWQVDIDPKTIQGDSVIVAAVVLDPTRTTTASNLQNMVVGIQVNRSDVGRFSLSGRDFHGESAIVLGKWYKKNGSRFAALGDGYLEGVSAFARHYQLKEIESLAEYQPQPTSGDPRIRLPEHIQFEGKVTTPKAWPGGRSPEVPRSLIPASTMILCTVKGELNGTGSGFFISPGGFLLTCAHNVGFQNEQYFAVSQSDSQPRPVEVIHRDEERDIALMWPIDRHGSEHWMKIRRKDRPPEIGDSIGLLGYPLGVSLGTEVSYSQGIVSSKRLIRGTQRLQIDAGALPGSSGCPVFDRQDGEVLGILATGFEVTGMHLNFAVDLQCIWDLGWLE